MELVFGLGELVFKILAFGTELGLALVDAPD